MPPPGLTLYADSHKDRLKRSLSRRDRLWWQPTPSDLVTGEPEVVVADDGTQTITYSINPDAVWSDGEPITSADFAYTALQIRDGDDIFDKTGYDRITAVDSSDPATAVVTLNSAYAGWRTLFSVYGVMPSHLLEGKDRAALMTDGYDFSGGPWKIEKWTRGTSVTLVPNENYWGEKPHLDKVTFLFLPDTTAAFQALRSTGRRAGRVTSVAVSACQDRPIPGVIARFIESSRQPSPRS